MKHLSEDELAEWLAGEATVEARAHVDECTECKAEATALRDGISRYALALRGEAEGRMQERPVRVTKMLATRRLGWAGVALALLLAAPAAWVMRPHAGPAGQNGAGTHTVETASQRTMSDDELLDAVDKDLDRDVPQALAPVSAITVARNQMAASSKIVNSSPQE